MELPVSIKGNVILKETTGRQNRRLVSIAVEFVMLFAFWLILSGHFQLKYILIGAGAAGLVTFLTNDLFYAALQQGENRRVTVWNIFLQIWRFLLYLPWLFSRIVMANVQVACLVLNPKMPIEPVLFLFSTKMKKGISRVTLANSITLTPGTITVDLENRNYIIHTLKPPLADELVNAVMQNKVAKVYLEDKEKPPEVRWVYVLEELKK